MTERLISVVLPVYNQADHIEGIVTQCAASLAHLRNPSELILVVNGCRDRSLEVCNRLAERHQNVRVLQSEQGGWGVAVKMGLQAARGEILCYTNSARITAQDLALMLLYGVSNPKAVIKANRKIRESWRRRLGSLLYNLECRALFDLPQWDINGTPKVFPRECERLLALDCCDDLIDLEFNVICRRENYQFLEVPIVGSPRHGGRSTTNYLSALRLYVGAFRLWRRLKGHQK